MSTTATPMGLRPVGLKGGRPFVGAFKQVKIASGLAVNIFNGDVVKILSTGTIDKETGTTTVTANAVMGVFMGCTYTDPNLGYKVHRSYWPTGTAASDAMAYVCDDPDVVYQIQASGSLAQTALGNNIGFVQNAGSTIFGKSRVSADHTSIGTGTGLPMKIVGFVEGSGSAIGDAFTDLLVVFNAGIHHYESATGI